MLSDEQLLIQETARNFAMREVLPVANELDPVKGDIPQSIRDGLAELGFFGILIPEEYGGLGLGCMEYCLVAEELSRAWMSVGSIIRPAAGTHAMTEEQKRHFFALVLEGHRFANALSETGGKNVQDIRTRLVAEGDGYRIDGRKGYCTSSLYAHWLGVLALDEQNNAQLAFVPRGTPGLVIVDDWASIGQRTTSSGTVLVEGLRVPAFNVFPTHRSYDVPTLAGPFAQITTAAIDAGIARAALRDTIAFVREQARPWIDAGVEKASEDPLTIIQVGGLDIRLEAAEALLERAGLVLDAGKAAPDEDKVAAASLAVARAKVLTTEIAIEASNKLFELGGTRSTLRKHNLDRHWRNARVHTLHDPVRWKYHAIGNYYLNDANPPRRGTI